MKKYLLLFSFFLPKSAAKNIHFFFKKRLTFFYFFCIFLLTFGKNGLLFFSFLKGNALFFRLTSIIIQGAQKVKPFFLKKNIFFRKKIIRKKISFLISDFKK